MAAPLLFPGLFQLNLTFTQLPQMEVVRLGILSGGEEGMIVVMAETAP
jgi:hypothetical protein